MQKCARCGTEFDGQRCPTCGEKAEAAAEEINKWLGKFSYLGMAGLGGTAAAIYLFPMLGRNWLGMIALCLFFLPLILHGVISRRKRPVQDVMWLKKVYLGCGRAVILIATVMVLNGALDWAPAMVVRSSILQMRVTRGRYSSTHHLVLASWRPGRATEDLAVPTGLYAGASIGQSVSVAVHKGLFGLPWYGKVTLE